MKWMKVDQTEQSAGMQSNPQVLKHFERFLQIQGYDNSQDCNGDYVNHEVKLLRQGFAWGMEAVIEEATRCIRELGERS